MSGSEPQLTPFTSTFFSGLGGNRAARTSSAAYAHARAVDPAAQQQDQRQPLRRGRAGDDIAEGGAKNNGDNKRATSSGKQQKKGGGSGGAAPASAHAAVTRFGAESSGKQLQVDVQWLELGLCKALTRATAHLGFLHPTPVQTAAIPLILAGHDVVARAVTGSGKSAALLLPLVHRLVTSPNHRQYHRGDGGPAAPHNTAAAKRGHMNGVVRSLILEPSRELGMQLHDFAASLSQFCAGLRTVLVIGGVAAQAQETQLAAGADIVVATPGRIIDLLYNYSNFEQGRHTPWASKSSAVVAGSSTNRGRKFDLSGVETVALDECDELLTSETLRPQIEDIFAKFLPPVGRRQTVLLSATLTKRVDDFVSSHMSEEDVRVVDIGKVALAAQLRQHFIRCGDLTAPQRLPAEDVAAAAAAAAKNKKSKKSSSKDEDDDEDDDDDDDDEDEESGVAKDQAVVHSSKRKTHFLVAACRLYYGEGGSKQQQASEGASAAAAAAATDASCRRVLIFAKHRTTVHRLAIIFQLLDLPAAELRGDLDADARTKALADFSSGAVRYLFTTDIASRGLDLPAVDTVVNFDLPPTLSSYIHRVGRTARIGKRGVAVSLVDDAEDGELMRKIIALSRTSDNVHQTSIVKRREVPAGAVEAAAQDVADIFPLVKNVLASEVVERQLEQADRSMRQLDYLTERQQNMRDALATQQQAASLAHKRGSARVGSVAAAVLPAPKKMWALSKAERAKREEQAREHYRDEVESKLTALQAATAESDSGLNRANQAQVAVRRRERDKKEAARERERAAQKKIRQKAELKVKAGVIKKQKQAKLRAHRREERAAKAEAQGGGKKKANTRSQKAKAGSKRYKRHKK